MRFLNIFKSPVHKPDGIWVAEAWLVWGICTGSTMYRERFDSNKDAAWAAKRAAKKLDWWLPQGENFGIRYGVRKVTTWISVVPIGLCTI